VKQFYDTFVDRVARGRNMSPADVDAVARGRVWTGEQAAARKLVDRLGGLREALDEARRLAHVPRETSIVELPEKPRDLLSLALSLAGLAQASEGGAPSADEPPPPEALPLPRDLVNLARALAPFAVFDPETPLARLEILPVLP
jgi:protease IV